MWLSNLGTGFVIALLASRARAGVPWLRFAPESESDEMNRVAGTLACRNLLDLLQTALATQCLAEASPAVRARLTAMDRLSEKEPAKPADRASLMAWQCASRVPKLGRGFQTGKWIGDYPRGVCPHGRRARFSVGWS